ARESRNRHADRFADDVDVAELRIVEPVGGDADAIRPGSGPGSIAERSRSRRSDLVHEELAAVGRVSKPSRTGCAVASTRLAQDAVEDRRGTCGPSPPPQLHGASLRARPESDRR